MMQATSATSGGTATGKTVKLTPAQQILVRSRSASVNRATLEANAATAIAKQAVSNRDNLQEALNEIITAFATEAGMKDEKFTSFDISADGVLTLK